MIYFEIPFIPDFEIHFLQYLSFRYNVSRARDAQKKAPAEAGLSWSSAGSAGNGGI
jgi:hypothetical protein